ncbi:MAG: DNA-binding response regulator [Bacteroidales bacterium 45-6]|nr:MAG: DNA-binding response regulator [Bacteroidales bacterium 45-6]
MIKVAIVDDEKHCIETLQHLLAYVEDVEVVFTTQASTEAKALIERYNPEILFLDVEMPFLSGFDLLQSLEDISFSVVFTTAHNKYAIKALKLNAIDYLLKPVSSEDIQEFFHNYRAKHASISKEQVAKANNFMEDKIQDTLALSTQNGLLFIKIDDIVYLEADSCYTHLVMHDNSRQMVSKTLANFEDILESNAQFYRPQKSYLINLKYIKQYIRGEGGEIIMQNGKSIALSRTKKQEFLSLFNKI